MKTIISPLRTAVLMPVLTLGMAMLAGCASTGGNQGNNEVATAVGKVALQTAVDAKCRTEIQKQSQWRMIGRVMSADQRAGWESRICGCASQEAVNTTSLTDMALIINPSTRDAAAANIAQRTIRTCINRLSRQ